MKRWITLILAAALAVLFGIAAYRFFMADKEDAPKRESKAFRCVRTVSVYASLVENPTASRVLLLGDLAEDYREFFEHAGLVCETNAKGEFDIVFAAGEWTPREAKSARSRHPSRDILALSRENRRQLGRCRAILPKSLEEQDRGGAGLRRLVIPEA